MNYIPDEVEKYMLELKRLSEYYRMGLYTGFLFGIAFGVFLACMLVVILK